MKKCILSNIEINSFVKYLLQKMGLRLTVFVFSTLSSNVSVYVVINNYSQISVNLESFKIQILSPSSTFSKYILNLLLSYLIIFL